MSVFPEMDWIKTVCKIGQGHDCCRYLCMGAGGWSCEKHGELKATIDHRVASGAFTARGDNCNGIRKQDEPTTNLAS